MAAAVTHRRLAIDPSVLQCLRDTSPRRYVTGTLALELPDMTGFAEGWHLELALHSRRGVTRNDDDGIDTCAFLGDAGVCDRQADLALLLPDLPGPCWMASHARAYVDLVLRDILQHGHARTRCLTSDIDHDATATSIRTMLQTALPRLQPTSRHPLSAWLSAPANDAFTG